MMINKILHKMKICIKILSNFFGDKFFKNYDKINLGKDLLILKKLKILVLHY